MAFGLEYFDADGSAVADGIFIPVANLPGLTSAELAAAQPATTKESKSIFAILNAIFATVSPSAFNKLGFAVTRGNPAGSGDNVFSQTFTHTWQKLVNLDAATIGVVPVPGSGANSGLGDFSIVDVFPGAAKIAAAASTGGAGIVIPTAELLGFTSLTHAGLTVSGSSDNREWFNALSDAMANAVSVRSATVSSALTAATVGTINALAIPTAYTQATDPISGILLADVPARGLITRINTFVVQSVLNQAAQTFDVNIATT